MNTETEKPPRRMSCWNCPRYLREERRCREGKANPKRKSDTFAVAETLGVRTLCHYNVYRDALAMRMFFPSAPDTIRLTAEARDARRRRAAEKAAARAADTALLAAPVPVHDERAA